MPATLPDGKTQQAIVANGLEFDRNGVLHVADTARGAIWKVRRSDQMAKAASRACSPRARYSKAPMDWRLIGAEIFGLWLTSATR